MLSAAPAGRDPPFRRPAGIPSSALVIRIIGVGWTIHHQISVSHELCKIRLNIDFIMKVADLAVSLF